MHVIIGAVGTSGDTLPMIELGRQLMANGHDVDFVGLAYFAERAAWAGLRFHAVGRKELFDEMASDPSVWHWHDGFRSLWKMLGGAMADTVATTQRLRREGTVLVGTSGAIGLRLAQEKFQLPMLTVHMSPFYFFSCDENCLGGFGAWPRWWPRTVRRVAMQIAEYFFMDAVCRRDVNASRATLALPPVRRIFTEWIHSPQSVACAVPSWFAQHQSDWPQQTRSVSFPVMQAAEAWTPSAALSEFLRAGEPPIVVSACTGAGAAVTFFHRAIEAARLINCRVILVSRFAAQIPQPLPSFATLIDYAPFDQLLPHTAAIIHNGGIGTMALAMRTGIPQIIVPFAYDQFFNAMRLSALDGGVTVRRQRDASQLAEVIRETLSSPRIAAGCRNLQARARASSDGLIELSRLVETFDKALKK
jgi:rhamnosyltransferase subunit B